MFEIQHRGFSAAARPLLRWLTVAVVCALAGCIYDVPITASGTRNIDAKLLGDWRSKDGKEQLKIRELNGTTYLLLLNGDPFRAYHSDFAGVAFVSVQDLDKAEQKFTYLKYTLSPDGTPLTAYAINSDTLPKSVRTSAAVRKLLRQNLANPRLYVDEPLELVKQR